MKRLLSVVLAILCVTSATGAFAQDKIKIGLIAPLSGPWHAEGQQAQQVVRLLAEEVNNKGGLLGKPVELVSGDDAGDAGVGVEAVQRLIGLGVHAVIGSYASAVTETIQQPVSSAGLVQITFGSTAVGLTERGLPHFFRTCARDDHQVETALRFLADWNLTKVALIHDTSHYSRDLATRIEQQLAARPLTVIYDTILAPGLKDYRPLLEDIQRSNPEVIFFTGYYPEAAVLLAGRKEMRWPVAFLAGAAAGGPGLVDVAGKKAVRGTYFLSMPLVKNLPALEAKRFVSLYRKRYGQRPSSIYALMAGDAFRVIAKAIESTGSTDSVKLAGYLHKDLNNFPGMTGLITFDAKGDREAQVYVPYRFDEKGRAEPAYK